MPKAKAILKHYWNYDAFRAPQADIIADIDAGKDVLSVLPTGFGKSLCFQVPVLMRDTGVCLVISPLVALMQDQVKQLEKQGIKAVTLTGNLSIHEQIRLLDNMRYGGVRFLYISPERLNTKLFQAQLKQLPIVLVVVDEAHCISEWGHDFRPSYLEIHRLRTIFPKVNITAFTATATPRVIEDIKAHLKLNDPNVYNIPSVRSNIAYKVVPTQDKHGQLLNYLQRQKGVGIVYVGSRKMTEHISQFLNHKGLKTTFYHAGLSKKDKDLAYNQWMTEQTPIIVATNAFGMGINKPNVRFVVHINLPSSIENYVQESGRVGRDGKPAEAVIIEEPADFLETEAIYLKSQPDKAFIETVYNHLNQYFKIAKGELSDQVFAFNLNSFCFDYKLPVLKTFYTLDILEREGLITQSQSDKQLHKLQILVGHEHLYHYYDNNSKQKRLIKSILRTYEGILKRPVVINPKLLAQRLEMTFTDVKSALQTLHSDKVIDYQYSNSVTNMTFLQPREDQYTLNRITHRVKQQMGLKQQKYNAMIAYVTNDSVCRQKQLADYFGEHDSHDCGQCDVCKNKTAKGLSSKALKQSIINLLQNNQSLKTQDLINMTRQPKAKVVSNLRILTDDGIITLNLQGCFELKK